MSNVLVGCCIGDSLGVAFESKPADNPLLLGWNGKDFLGSEHHGLKPTQYSDDGQMSVCLARSIIDNNGFNPDDVAKRYVDLFTSNTIRGYGRTTKTAIDNLIAGKHWSESGVEGSYGDGTLMRVGSIGMWYRDDLKTLIEVATIDAKITHNSDEAIAGSIAGALTVAYSTNGDTEDLLKKIHERLPDSKVKTLIYSLPSLLINNIQPATALRVLGTKADVREICPSSLYCFLKFDKWHQAVETAIRGGGDTDTLGSIVSGFFTAKNGLVGIDPHFFQVESFDQLVLFDSQLFNRSGENFLTA